MKYVSAEQEYPLIDISDEKMRYFILKTDRKHIICS